MLYKNKFKKLCELKDPIVKAFKEQFPNIYNSASELEHYLDSCIEYACHRLKGIEYSLPFPVENDVLPTPEDFKLIIDEPASPESKPLQKSGTSLEEFLEYMRIKASKPLVIRQKETYPKKHTLSILLTQEKEKTKKLQGMIQQSTVNNGN